MEKKIDAVEVTRQIREAHYERLKDASPEERIRFFREKARRVQEEAARYLSPEQEPGSETA